MNYDALLDRQQLDTPLNVPTEQTSLQKLPASKQFVIFLNTHRMVQGQLHRWMESMHLVGWKGVGRIHKNFLAHPESLDLADYLNDHDQDCQQLLYWLEMCSSDGRFGVDGMYDQFVNWVAAQEIKQ